MSTEKREKKEFNREYSCFIGDDEIRGNNPDMTYR